MLITTNRNAKITASNALISYRPFGLDDKETLHTEEYKRFNTQRANELQGINKQIRETITRKVNSVDELKTQSASLIAKIKKLNNDDLINELETDYNVLCKQIKQTEQEISELNGQIAENDAEIKRNVEQKDFSKMEQSALYKENCKRPSIIPSLPCVAFWK